MLPAMGTRPLRTKIIASLRPPHSRAMRLRSKTKDNPLEYLMHKRKDSRSGSVGRERDEW